MSGSRTVRVMIRLQYCRRVFPCCQSHGLLLRLHPRANEVATATVATSWPLGIRQLNLNSCLAADPQVITSFLSSVGQSVRLLTSRSGVRASQGAVHDEQPDSIPRSLLLRLRHGQIQSSNLEFCKHVLP